MRVKIGVRSILSPVPHNAVSLQGYAHTPMFCNRCQFQTLLSACANSSWCIRHMVQSPPRLRNSELCHVHLNKKKKRKRRRKTHASPLTRSIHFHPRLTETSQQVIPSSTIEMRTKLFPDETAEALDELEYHPHHVHASGARGSGGPTPGAPAPAGATGAAGAVPSTASSPTAPGVPANSPQAVFGGGIGAEASPRAVESAQGGGGGAVGAAGDGTEARGACGRGGSRGRKDGGGEGKGASMMQRMSKTFRPDPLAAYAGDRSTLKFKPRRQEGLTTLRPRQQRTVFDAAQISPLLQVW